ncbi:MAG: secretin N-terminal domain-containing protein [Planctomycetota bacterium]|nr:secretin N-terminal domain-containing protein [Planctomycetota bacterium]
MKQSEFPVTKPLAHAGTGIRGTAQRLRAGLLTSACGLFLSLGLVAQDPVTKSYSLDVQGDNIIISLNENQGLPLFDFIKIAEQITKKTFTYTKDEIDQSQPIHFVGPMRSTRDNFFGFFQTVLYIKGFACSIRGEGQSELINIINMRGQQRSEMNAGARHVPSDELENYKNQTGVTILSTIPLEHLDSTRVTAQLRPFFANATGQGSPMNFVTVHPKSLLVQGFAPQVYQAYRLLKLVDVPAEEIDMIIEPITLEHAAAEELELLLTDLLSDRNRQRPQQGAQAQVQNQTPPVKVLAQVTTNMLIISGSREQVMEAKDLIAQLDRELEAAEGDSHVIQLQNVLVKDLAQTLKTFLDQEKQAEQQAQSGQAAAQARRPRNPVVVAHEESNKLLVSAPSTKFKQLRKMIEELDERQRQVLVECAVVELSTSDGIRFGIELGLLDVREDGDFTRPFGFSHFGQSNFEDSDDDGLPDTRLPDFENPLTGITGGIISGGDFAIPVLINALATDNSANILSLPSVIVNNNENAVVTSKEERPTSNVSQGTATTQSGFSGFQDAGINLTISPSISSNNYLRLNINLSVSRFITAFDPSSSGPGVKSTREIQTQVTLPSGQTMVIGGVIEDSESEAESGVPLLKDIPLLGWLFKTYVKDKNKTNLYFFITPHILDETDFSDLDELSTRKKLEAEHYIGPRRLKIIDRKWDSSNKAETLDDPGANIENLDKGLGFEFPNYRRPPTESKKPPTPGKPKAEPGKVEKGKVEKK